jgi:cytochrome b involved in lipid metabolism
MTARSALSVIQSGEKERAQYSMVYSREEVARHNSYEDCWVILDGEVLALSKEFLEDHPGGSDTIFQRAGQDITQEFNEQSHSASALYFARRYCIGALSVPIASRRQVSKSQLFLGAAEHDEAAAEIFPSASRSKLGQNGVGNYCNELRTKLDIYGGPDLDLRNEYLSISMYLLSAVSAGALAWRLLKAASDTSITK